MKKSEKMETKIDAIYHFDKKLITKNKEESGKNYIANFKNN